MRQVLQKPKASGRLLKWVIKLGQFDINYHPRIRIKGQALADFIVEFTYSNTTEVVGIEDNVEVVKAIENGEASATRQEDTDQWILYFDDGSN